MGDQGRGLLMRDQKWSGFIIFVNDNVNRARKFPTFRFLQLFYEIFSDYTPSLSGKVTKSLLR